MINLIDLGIAFERPKAPTYEGTVITDASGEATFKLNVSSIMKHDSWISIQNIDLLLGGEKKTMNFLVTQVFNISEKRYTRLTQFTTEIFVKFSDHLKQLEFEVLYTIPNSNNTFKTNSSMTTLNFYDAFGGKIFIENVRILLFCHSY